MLFLSKHKSNGKRDRQDCRQQQMAESIIRHCIAIHYQASKFLQNKFETLAIGSKRLTVIAFCITGFSSSVYLMIKSFSKKDHKPISITAIRVPKQAEESGRQRIHPANVITKEEFEKIGRFRLYLDSLDMSDQGKRIHDSIIINRPGLIDSLAAVEKKYQLQSPNK